MQKNIVLIIASLILFTFGGWLFYANNNNFTKSNPTTPPSENISPPPTQQQTATEVKVTKTSNIILKSPENQTSVNRNFTISGEARVFENMLQIRVINKRTNQILVNQPVMANAPDVGTFGPFSYSVNLGQSNTQTGDQLQVEAFQYSAKDGSEVDKTSITVNLR